MEVLNYLLQEDLGKILQENASGILLEDSVIGDAVWTPRTRVSSIWGKRTRIEYLLLEDLFSVLQEDGFKIVLEDSVYNIWDTPRKANYIEGVDLINIFDLTGTEILTVSGNETSKIDTTWQ